MRMNGWKTTIALCFCLAFMAFFLLSTSVLASDVSGARYSGTVRVSDNSTAATNVSTVFTLSSQELINLFNILSTFENTAIQSSTGGDIIYQPSANSTYPWVIFVPAISASSSIDDKIYAGGSDMSGKIRYCGGATGMKVDDDPSLEFGNNFALTIKGFFDFSKSNYEIAYKQGAWRIIEPSSGYARFALFDNESPTSSTDPLSQFTDDAYSYDGNTATYAYDLVTAGTTGADLDLTFPGGYKNTDTLRYYVTRQDTNITGVFIDVYYNGSYHTLLNGAPPSWGAWNEVSLGAVYNAGTVRVKFINTGGSNSEGRLNELERVCSEVTVTNSGALTSGEYTANITADGSNLKLYMNGVLKGTSALGSYSVYDSDYDLYLCKGDALPYMEYSSITVGGTPVSRWEWEYGTTFEDSIGSNDAIPSFRTASSNANVSASLVSWEPISQAKASSTILGSAGELVTDPPTQPAKFYIPEEEISLFFAPLINSLLDAGNIPHALFWYTLAFAIILAGGYLSFKFNQSIFITAATMWALTFLFVCLNFFGGWTLIYFTCEEYGILILSKHYGW